MITLKKIIQIGLVAFAVSSNVGATPNGDLVFAVTQSDLEGMNLALKQGADPNIKVCVSWHERAHPNRRFMYPLESQKCDSSLLRDAVREVPLMWGIELYDASADEKRLAMEELLVSAGARKFKGEPYLISKSEGGRIFPDLSGYLQMFDWSTAYGNEPPLLIERAMVFMRAGWVLSAKDLDTLKRMSHGWGERFISAITADVKVSFAICQSEFDKLAPTITSLDEFKKYVDDNNIISFCQSFSTPEKNMKAIVEYEEKTHIKATEEAEDTAKQEMLRAKEEARQEKIAAAERAKKIKQLYAFRKSLTEGDETNCGPVIESKGKLVKIAFAVANYGNEHWVRRDEIFPPDYGCRFVNGQYQMPE